MRIQHNIMAMNAYRNYNSNTKALSGNLEKLSSGYKINRAGDDAAGLAISEKMRAQITGLDAAQKNVKDGISLVKTAEGAMQEIQDMLNRMDYLATQSANGTYDNEVDRANLQKEVNNLKEEINRIADSANFNGIKLLDGSLAAEGADDSAPVEGTEIQDKAIVIATGMSKTVSPGASFTAEAKAIKQNDVVSVKISYTNAAGEEKSLILADAGKAAAASANDQGEKLATGINSGTWTVSDTSGNSKDDLAEFKKLFNVTGSGKNISIAAKDPDSGAKVTGISQSADTKATQADSIATLPAGALSGTYQKDPITRITCAATGNSITLNGKTYTSTATVAGTAASDLVKLLQEDGFDVTLEDSTNGVIRFNDASQLRETQKGVQIVNTDADKWDVTADASTKGSAVFKMETPVDGNEHTFTVNYINEAGEAVSREVSYKAAATTAATDNSTALKAAIEGDSELSSLFKVTEPPTADGTLTITSKSSGTSSAYITGISMDGQKVASNEVTISKPLDTGKTLALASGKSIENGDQITVDGKTYQFMSDTGAAADAGVVKVAIGDDAEETWKNLQKALSKNGVESSLHKNGTGTVDGLRFVDGPVKSDAPKSGGLTLQIGDTSDKFNQMKVIVGDMHTKAMGKGKTTLDGKEIDVTKTIADIDIGTQEGAAEAVAVIKNAINYVSSVRGDLGAIQNRLDHTANNLSVMAENIQDAESTIRDTDVANEMMSYVKNNILVQSAQAMLAQANQVPQGVLQLLG